MARSRPGPSPSPPSQSVPSHLVHKPVHKSGFLTAASCASNVHQRARCTCRFIRSADPAARDCIRQPSERTKPGISVKTPQQPTCRCRCTISNSPPTARCLVSFTGRLALVWDFRPGYRDHLTRCSTTWPLFSCSGPLRPADGLGMARAGRDRGLQDGHARWSTRRAFRRAGGSPAGCQK